MTAAELHARFEVLAASLVSVIQALRPEHARAARASLQRHAAAITPRGPDADAAAAAALSQLLDALARQPMAPTPPAR